LADVVGKKACHCREKIVMMTKSSDQSCKLKGPIMERKNYRFVQLTENIEIPVPIGCTKEEEQEVIAKFRAEHNLVDLEKDYRLLARQMGEGIAKDQETFPLEDLIHELQETQKQFAKGTP
jgi:hypothetical protein